MLRDLRFALVRAVGAVLHPFIRRIDPRATPLPEQQQDRPARTIHWDLSKLTWVGPEPFWWQQRTHELPAAFHVELQDAEMIGHGVVIDATGAVILESTLFQESYFRRSHVDHLIVGRRLLRSEEYDTVIPLTNYLDMSYFHWTMESIGRLAPVEKQIRIASWKVLISDKAPRFARTTMDFLLGIGADRVVTGTAKRKRLKRCLLVSNPHTRSVAGGVEVYPPEHIRWLNERGHQRIGGVRPERRNFIISRHKQVGRRITNEDLLLQHFPQLNFERVTLEDLSIHDQVDLFAHAGVIVAVHGAGLTNLVYTKDAAVIELYPTHLQAKNSAYFVQIAAHLGLPHLVLHFEGKGEAPNWDHTLTESDLSHMRSFLEKWGWLSAPGQ